jgi:ABC-type branched-subunit amino acid transport system permease subunit
MLLRSKALPERGSLIRRALPAALPPRHVWQWTAALAGVCLILAFALHGGFLVALGTSLVGFLLALSLLVLTGYVGQVSLAQYMFAGVAAFLLSRLTQDWGVPFPLAPFAAAAAASLAGVVMAVPAVRVRGINLAVLTLSAGVAVEAVYFSNAAYVGGGGTPTVTDPALFGLQLGIGTPGQYPRAAFVLMMIVVAIPLALLVVGVRRSRIGLQMLAVRANERAAAANGINVVLVKVLAFGISAFLAGLAGAFAAYLNYGGFSAASFDALLSLGLVASVFVVGITSMSGAVLAALAFAGGLLPVILQQYVPFQTWYGVFAGGALILSAVTVPDGISVHLAEQAAGLRQLTQMLGLLTRCAAGARFGASSSGVLEPAMFTASAECEGDTPVPFGGGGAHD